MSSIMASLQCGFACGGKLEALRAPRTTSRGRAGVVAVEASKGEVTLLDYGAGNVRSVRNAIKRLGYDVVDVEKPSDIANAKRLIFPGVGSFGSAMDVMKARGYVDPLKDYLAEGKPFLGICLGLQLLFEGSEESNGVEGLGIIPGKVAMFDTSLGLPVPHIGWNGISQRQPSQLYDGLDERRVYFVHSFRATEVPENSDWVLSTSNYAGEFISSVQKGAVHACQFHPEKSGDTGLQVLGNFMSTGGLENASQPAPKAPSGANMQVSKRVIACLDVRSNDTGDLVVTKGDQYDVREKGDGGDVRNLGAPVDLSRRYFEDGADEVTFLNITGFRDFPLGDMPMLEVLRKASETVFVPLTVGGGIKEFTDSEGTYYSALEVASEYFRSGADKVSIGSDAVAVAEEYRRTGVKTGKSSIELISERYGAQAVVVSIDPRRVYVADPADAPEGVKTIRTARPGPAGEEHCWFQCTIMGGREGRPIGAYELAIAVEALGAGEILLNCIDNDGQGDGFDLELVSLVSGAVTIPVIASSGAGKPEHFTEVFKNTGAAAGLAAGIFHRREVSIAEVKERMDADGIPTRLV